jgi:precorrin-4 methylase
MGGDPMIHFIGAGPGAPDLLTLRAQRLIATSRVCLYAGALVPPEVVVLTLVREQALEREDPPQDRQ